MGVGDRGGRGSEAEGRFGKEANRGSSGTVGLGWGAHCSDPRRPAGGTRRTVSAFHPPPALQVGRLRPGEGGGQPSPGRLRTGGAVPRLPQFLASGLHSSCPGLG